MMLNLLSERTNRFSQRVDIERQVLSILNNELGAVSPISGLTKSSFEKWKVKIADKLSNEQNSNLESTVNEIIYRVQIDCDASKDVFHEPPMDIKEKSIDTLLSRLKTIFK